MCTPSLIIKTFFFLLFLTSCSRQSDKNINVQIQGDTLKIITQIRGDTVFKNYIRLDKEVDKTYADTSIYTSKLVDTTIKLSNFYFIIDDFKIYFDTAKVIAYCDSVIQYTPVNIENNKYSENWGVVNSVSDLKKFAESGKRPDGFDVDWLTNLLKRFNPLILDLKKNSNAKKLLIEEFTNGINGYGSVSYYLVTNQRDTILITGQREALEEIKL